MEPGTLNIQINWIYFLGIMGSLIAIAWYTSGRFSKLETAIEWLKDSMKDLKVDSDNLKQKAFGNASPIVLTDKGNELLNDSGLKGYIDQKRNELIKSCEIKRDTNAYEVQEFIFGFFDNLKFESEFENKIKQYAYRKGVTLELLRRVGAIYFRGICLGEFQMKEEDIDRHK